MRTARRPGARRCRSCGCAAWSAAPAAPPSRRPAPAPGAGPQTPAGRHSSISGGSLRRSCVDKKDIVVHEWWCGARTSRCTGSSDMGLNCRDRTTKRSVKPERPKRRRRCVGDVPGRRECGQTLTASASHPPPLRRLRMRSHVVSHRRPLASRPYPDKHKSR